MYRRLELLTVAEGKREKVLGTAEYDLCLLEVPQWTRVAGIWNLRKTKRNFVLTKSVAFNCNFQSIVFSDYIVMR